MDKLTLTWYSIDTVGNYETLCFIPIYEKVPLPRRY
jgi:hypothetical protein